MLNVSYLLHATYSRILYVVCRKKMLQTASVTVSRTISDKKLNIYHSQAVVEIFH